MSFVLHDENLPAILNARPMSDEEFSSFCSEHPHLFFEMTAEGELVVMAPTHAETAMRNSRIGRYLDVWAEQDGRGVTFDSSGGFVLPNGARRSPDASWTLKTRIQKLTPSSRKGFPNLCPDFVIELRSDSDRLKPLQAKMREYIANGAQLGWLIDPGNHSVTIYRPNTDPETRANIDSVTGEGLLATFVLNLSFIWNPLGD